MGVSLTGDDRRAVRELRARVRDEAPGRRVLDWLVSQVGNVLRSAYVVAHRLEPSIDGEGWQPRYLAAYPETFGPRLRPYWTFLRGSPSASGSYDPLQPEPAQRNRVLLLPELHARGLTRTTERLYEEVFPRIGVAGLDQIRVLLCDGPRLLAWFGGFRVARYGARERAILRALVPELVARLKLEDSLRTARIHEVGLEAALDLLGAAAFLVDHRGRVVLASRAGRALVERGGRAGEAVAAALAGAGERATVVPVRAPGMPAHRLVVLQGDPRGVDVARLRRLAQAWRLTPRQTQVLECLVVGDANKVIAGKLGCAVGTVEIHVSRVLAKAGLDSRAAVVAAFWR